MNNKFYFFSIYFTFSLTCSFPSWSVITKITRLLLDNKQIILLHDYHLPDHESAAQRDVLIQFIDNCKKYGINVSLLIEAPNEAAKETNAKMSSSAVPQIVEFSEVIKQSVLPPLPKSKIEEMINLKKEKNDLIAALKDFGTSADWRVPFFTISANSINQVYQFKHLSKVNSLTVLEQENGLSLFLEYLDELEKMLFDTLVSYDILFRKYGEIESQIEYNDKLIKFGRADIIVVELLNNLNTVIRPKYKIINENLKPMGFLSATNLIGQHSQESLNNITLFLMHHIADVGFYLQIIEQIQHNDVVILAAGSSHCSYLANELKEIGAIERQGVLGLTDDEVSSRLEIRRKINSAGLECNEDDFEKITIAINEDEYRGLFQKVWNLKTKAENERCNLCDESSKILKCSRCQKKYYCSKSCQVKDWPVHKKACVKP